MAKKLNKNLVVGLAALGFAVTTVAGVVLVKTLQQSDPTELAAKAEAYVEQEDWQRAAQFYSRAFAVSNEAIYRVRTADMLRKLERELEALQIYREAVIIEPDLLEAQEKVLDLLLEISEISPNSTDNWMQVRQTADDILAIEGQADHARAMYGRGAALLGLRALAPDNEVKGVEALERAVELDPDAVEVATTLSNYYRETNQPAQAERVIHNLVEHTPGPGMAAAEARCLLADFQANEEDYDAAAQTLEEALRLAGDDQDARATVLAQTGRFWTVRWAQLERAKNNANPADDPTDDQITDALDRAMAAADAAIEADPDGFEGYTLRAALHRQKGELDKAIAVLKQRLDQPFQREGLESRLNRIRRYSLLLTLGDLYVVKITETPPGTPEREEMVVDAKDYIDQAQGEFPTGAEVPLLRGKLHYITGEYAQAVRWFEQAEQYSRGLNPTVMHFLALARMQIGQIGGAHEAILQAISTPEATAPVWNTYARVLLQLDQPQEALAAANQALARNPQNRDSVLLKAAALERMGQDREVAAVIGTLDERSDAIVVAQARLAQRMGRTDEAIAMLEEAVADAPANVRLVSALAEIYRNAERKADAQRIIDAALAEAPGDFDLKLLQLNFSDLSADERRAHYETLVNEIDDAYQRAIRLSGIYEQEGDAEARYQQLFTAFELIRDHKTPAARQAGENAARALVDAMFQIAAENKQPERLDQLLEIASNWNEGLGLDAAEGQSYRGRRMLVDAYWASEAAVEAARKGDEARAEAQREATREAYDRAIEALEIAAERFPSNGQTYAQLGEAYLRTGRLSDARAALEKAANLLPRSETVVKRLAQLALQSGDEQSFNTWLNRAAELAPEDPWVAEQLVVRQEETNPREGIARREQIRTEDPDDLRNLLKLAQLYQKIGDYGKAEQRLDEVLARDTQLAFAPAIAQLFRMIDQPKRALKVLEDNLRQTAPEDKARAQLLIGDHYDALQDPAADAAFLAAADFDANATVCLEIGRHFFRRARFDLADEWLQKAADIAEASDSVQRSEIEQMRIETLVRMDELERAGERVAAYREAFPNDPVGTFLNAQVLNAKGETLAALNELESFIEQRDQASVSSHQYELALYRHAQYSYNLGRWQDCVRDLEELAATNPTAFRFLPRVLLSRVYRKIGRQDAAIQELERIYREHPEADMAIEALIDAYLRDERYGDASAVLAAMRNRQPSNVTWLERSGDVAYAQKDANRAVEYYRDAAVASGYRPALCVKVLKVCEEFRAAEQGIRFFEDVIPPDRRTPEVMLPYARLLVQRGDVEAAVDIYRLALYRAGFESFEFLADLVSSVYQSLGQDALAAFTDQPADEMFTRANDHIVTLLRYAAGQHQEALESAEALLATTDDANEKANLHYLIGRVYDGMAEWQKSKAAYLAALEANDAHLAALNDLAYLLTDKLNQPAEAIPYARRAVRVSSAANLLDTLDTLGWAYLNLGGEHVKEAIGQFTRARELDPDYPPINYHLAEALRRQGQFNAAAELFAEVTALPAGGEYEEYREKAQAGLQKANAGVSD